MNPQVLAKLEEMILIHDHLLINIPPHLKDSFISYIDQALSNLTNPLNQLLNYESIKGFQNASSLPLTSQGEQGEVLIRELKESDKIHQPKGFQKYITIIFIETGLNWGRPSISLTKLYYKPGTEPYLSSSFLRLLHL